MVFSHWYINLLFIHYVSQLMHSGAIEELSQEEKRKVNITQVKSSHMTFVSNLSLCTLTHISFKSSMNHRALPRLVVACPVLSCPVLSCHCVKNKPCNTTFNHTVAENTITKYFSSFSFDNCLSCRSLSRVFTNSLFQCEYYFWDSRCAIFFLLIRISKIKKIQKLKLFVMPNSVSGIFGSVSGAIVLWGRSRCEQYFSDLSFILYQKPLWFPKFGEISVGFAELLNVVACFGRRAWGWKVSCSVWLYSLHH